MNDLQWICDKIGIKDLEYTGFIDSKTMFEGLLPKKPKEFLDNSLDLICTLHKPIIESVEGND